MDFRNVYTDVWFWASRNGAVDFFSDTNKKHVLVVFQEYTFYNVKLVELCKISEGFLTKNKKT